jgi:hypothetical protein
MLEVFLRIDELSFVFVVVSRLAHRVTLILAVTRQSPKSPRVSRSNSLFPGHRKLPLATPYTG